MKRETAEQQQAKAARELKLWAKGFSSASRADKDLIEKLGKGLRDRILTPADFKTDGLVCLAVLTYDHLQIRIWGDLKLRTDITIRQLRYLKLMMRVPQVLEEVEALRLVLVARMRASNRQPLALMEAASS